MKYQEYQAWFHTFNNAYSALCHIQGITTNEVEIYANRAAEFALEKFKEVKMPETPDLSNIDLAGIFNKVANETIGKKR